ncbi:MAG: hypothetical protein IJ511_07450 [Bacteroides sp.]|nr:hypothetical protein [Bacteroides sp.]
MDNLFTILAIVGFIMAKIFMENKKRKAAEELSGEGSSPFEDLFPHTSDDVPEEDDDLQEIPWEEPFHETPQPRQPEPAAPAYTTPAAETMSHRTTASPEPVSEPMPDTLPDTPIEMDIHSPEEVRRGILWSEILQRKYC